MSFVERRGDSVLEEQFWQMLLRSKEGWALALDQFQIGRHRVDVIADCDGEAVVIELDGEAFHPDKEADERRDLELLNDVSAVIRIPYHAMRACPFASFVVLSHWYPRFTIPLPSNVINFQDLGRITESQDFEIWDVAYPFRVGRSRDFVDDSTATISIRRGSASSPWIIGRIKKQQRTNG